MCCNLFLLAQGYIQADDVSTIPVRCVVYKLLLPMTVFLLSDPILSNS